MLSGLHRSGHALATRARPLGRSPALASFGLARRHVGDGIPLPSSAPRPPSKPIETKRPKPRTKIEGKLKDETHKGPVFRLRGQALVSDDDSYPRTNPVGIQLLSRSLHGQIFPQAQPVSPDTEDIATSRKHLHDNHLLLEQPPAQPEINFQLPRLQGATVDEHFYNLGVEESEPWLTLAEDLAVAPTPDLPAEYSHKSGWTRYDPVDGSQTSVPYPDGETMLTFDVEVLYKIYPYPVMAAACSPTHWYTWISPWLLSESTNPEHLVPLGPPEHARVIVGHNVGYDRSKVEEEYALAGTNNRFLDTMSFHIATQGVSGPQRGRWMGYWKDIKARERDRKALEKAIIAEIEVTKEKIANGEETEEIEVVAEPEDDGDAMEDEYREDPLTDSNVDETEISYRTINLAEKLDDLERQLKDLPKPEVIDGGKKRRVALDKFGEPVVAEPLFDAEITGEAASDSSSIWNQAERARRAWEDITSTNGLGEVYKLHFHGEELDKSARDAFSAENPYGVRQDLDNLMRYCASDVHATHKVYKKVFPRFRRVCPSPVSFAGQLKMGSAFLPVDKSWDDYRASAEGTYVKLNVSVRQKLAELAEQERLKFVEPAMDWRPPLKGTHALVDLECPDQFRDDPWLSQLDWTPKPAKWIQWQQRAHLGMSTVKTKKDEQSLMPVNWQDLSKSKVIPPLFGLKWGGNPMVWSEEHGWVYRIERPLSTSSESEIDKKPPHLPPLKFTNADDLALLAETRSKQSVVTFHALPLGPRGAAGKASGWLSKAFIGKPIAKARLSCDDPSVLDMARTEDWNGLRDKVKVLLEKKGLLEQQGQKFAPDPTSGARDAKEDAAPTSPDSTDPTMLDSTPASGGSDDPDWEPADNFYLKPSPAAMEARWWPQWYHALLQPKAGHPQDNMNLTVKTTLAASLLRLTWHGHPLYKSREYGWVYRVPVDELEEGDRENKVLDFAEGALAASSETLMTEEDALAFRKEASEAKAEATRRRAEEEAATGKPSRKPLPKPTPTLKRHPDVTLHQISQAGTYVFLKVPHPNGGNERVGSMITKTSVKDFEEHTLSSVFPLAREAIDMNAQCSYWVSVRDRVKEQMVVTETEDRPMGFKHTARTSSSTPSPPIVAAVQDSPPRERQGLILPHVVVMGTITRRAIEKTWLTASNAKKNRVGSELKAMVRAPEGYSIVGADVDSEELWIAGLMGDAQIGLHGGSAIGWMTLEGTKAAGTDVHSKTASITGTTRDAAKAFNYSRIYGAGVKHASQLLMDAMKPPDLELATEKAESLYRATKGSKIHWKTKDFHTFWHGGTESYLFNAMEQVARSARPRTPALQCGVTMALQEEYLEKETEHMTSRINWAVQSSGVDYLHLLIVATDYLCRHYEIDARYLISVHDEVRYLVKNEDATRAALAMQIANLWTRSQFAFKLGMEDLPQGVAFFSAVDVDTVLRKEVFMECVTPSNPVPIPPGFILDINQTLEQTNGGSLHRDGSPMSASSSSAASPAPSPRLLSLSPSYPLNSPATIPRPRPYRPQTHSTGFATEKWKRFFLKAQALKEETEIEELWKLSGKPPDPIRTTYKERQMRRMGKRFEGGYVRGARRKVVSEEGDE